MRQTHGSRPSTPLSRRQQRVVAATLRGLRSRRLVVTFTGPTSRGGQVVLAVGLLVVVIMAVGPWLVGVFALIG